MSAFVERLRAALAPDYELLRELGSGGMGTVYLARDIRFDSSVAVKVLRPELWTVEAEKQFVEEARILRRLAHANIVPVHDVDERQGLTFYVMDYLAGDTVQSRLEERSEEHTSELQSQSNLVCRLLLEKKKIYLASRFVPSRRRLTVNN